MSTETKIKGAFALLLIVVGFVIGRCTTETGIKLKYVEGATIRDTVYSPTIRYSTIPEYVFLPMKSDTIMLKGDSIVVVQNVDTLQIIAEYVKENYYKEVLFDTDTTGSLSVDALVQFNRLQCLSYKYKPISKEKTVLKSRTFTPFVCTSLNTFGYAGAGMGLYYSNVGASIKYVTDFEGKGIEMGVQVKF